MTISSGSSTFCSQLNGDGKKNCINPGIDQGLYGCHVIFKNQSKVIKSAQSIAEIHKKNLAATFLKPGIGLHMNGGLNVHLIP